MKKKQTYKRIAAWMLVFSMIFGSNSSVVFADGLTAENTASAAETAVSAAEEVPAVGEQGTLENLAAPAAVSDENGQAVLTEIPADDAPEEVIPGAAEEVLTDEFLPDGELSGAENGEFAVDGKLSAAENEEPAAAEELSEAGKMRALPAGTIFSSMNPDL